MLKIVLAGLVGSAAVLEDLTHRRISNWIPATALVGGAAIQSSELGWHGAASALLGCIVGASTFLLFYILGGMGGGDIKLMAGFGAMLGPQGILNASLCTAACGGVLAVAWLGGNKLAGIFRGKSGACGEFGRQGPTPDRMESLPYAPAIAAGVWITLLVTG